MASTNIGTVTHTYKDGSQRTLCVKVINEGSGFIVVEDEEEGIIINSREQWNILKALMDSAFSVLEDRRNDSETT